MANNFRITGTRYISKDGNDGNSGATADLAKATFADYAVATHAVGSGVYKGAFTIAGNAVGEFLFDGTVVINCTGNFVSGNAVNGARTKTFGNTNPALSGLMFINLNGFNLLNTPNAAAVNYNRVCLIGGTISTASAGNANWSRSVFESITGTLSLGAHIFSYHRFFNCTLTMPSTSVITDTYCDAATTIQMAAYFGTPATQFKNCNFQGVINIAGTPYELKKDKDGNAIDPNPGIADIATIDATVYDRGNFSQDPDFANIEKRDYWSVNSTSPMLFASQTGLDHIGGVYASAVVKATDAEFTGGVITDLTTSSNDLILDGLATTGTAVSDPFEIAPIAQVIGRLPIAMALNFNSDLALGNAENNNTTSTDNYADATQGANPRRLAIEMRWCSSNTAPTVDADYDNNGYTAAGDWVKFEAFTVPKVDAAGYGTGSPEYNPLTSANIKARYVQLRITVRNGLG